MCALLALLGRSAVERIAHSACERRLRTDDVGVRRQQSAHKHWHWFVRWCHAQPRRIPLGCLGNEGSGGRRGKYATLCRGELGLVLRERRRHFKTATLQLKNRTHDRAGALAM